MTKAKESALNMLHGAFAQVLLSQLSEHVIEETGDGKRQVIYAATPALLTVVGRFLKDNEITVESDDDETQGELKQQLAARKKRSRLTNITPIDEDIKEISV